MPKLFRTIFIILSTTASLSGQAGNNLCPDPVKIKEDTSLQPQPSADVYHESMQKAVAQATRSLDWVDAPDSDSVCGGYYLAPPNPNPQQHLNPEDADIYMSADMAEKSEDGFTTLKGDVELYQGRRRIRCDSMRYSEEKEYSEVKGDIQLREPGLLVLSQEAIFDNQNKTSSFNTTEYVLHEQQAHGKAGKIAIDASEQGFLFMEHASFTVCPPTHELWSFDARRIEVDNNKGWGKMYSAFFEIENFPVFYIPYIDFPIDKRRKTGLLWPSFSSTSSGGYDITLPYYFNLMPQADMTYVARYNSDHGYLHGVELRYKNKYSEWTTGGTFIDNDKQVGNVLTKDDHSLSKKRWMGFIKENGRFNANWSTRVDYQDVSDINYFRDWGTVGFDVQKSLNIRRFATVNFTNESWKASSTVVDYQSLELDPATGDTREEEYRRLPTLNVYYRNSERNFDYNPMLFSQYTFFDHEQRIRAHRLYLAPGALLPMRWEAGEIVSTFTVKHNAYYFNNSNDASEALQPGTVYQGRYDVNVPAFSMNNRLFFERELDVGSHSFVQTLTPRMFYYYADYEDQSYLPNFDTVETSFSYDQLFRENRFGSYDRIGDANQVSLALESQLINSDDGRKLFSVGIGQIHYFRDRLVTAYSTDAIPLEILPTDDSQTIQDKKLINQEIDRRYYREASDVALQPNWYINDQQRISGSFIWDPYLNKGQEAAIGYHYRDDEQRIINVAYRYKRTPAYNNEGSWFVLDDVNQTDFSLYIPLNRKWHAYLRWNYDLSNRTTIEDISGVKYEGCCFSVMLAYQRERKTFANNVRVADTAPASFTYNWFIQFELKGLGGITNTITHLLEESIEGYKERESNL